MSEPMWLFTYGTLRLATVQKLFFGPSFAPFATQCYIENHRLFSDGLYHFVKEEKGFKVNGELLKLQREQIKIVDLWEEVPRYKRKKTWVEFEDQKREGVFAWCYYGNGQSGHSVRGDAISHMAEDKVIEEARDFLSQLQPGMLRSR